MGGACFCPTSNNPTYAPRKYSNKRFETTSWSPRLFFVIVVQGKLVLQYKYTYLGELRDPFHKILNTYNYSSRMGHEAPIDNFSTLNFHKIS